MIGKVLTRLFALFGMTLTCVACYGVPDAEYMPEWAASGRVVDPEGEPIEGIKVSMDGDVCLSNPNGRFYVEGNDPYLSFEDVDGKENGGEFKRREIFLYDSNGTYAGSDLGEVQLERKGEE